LTSELPNKVVEWDDEEIIRRWNELTKKEQRTILEDDELCPCPTLTPIWVDWINSETTERSLIVGCPSKEKEYYILSSLYEDLDDMR